jgi:hypothetical protein
VTHSGVTLAAHLSRLIAADLAPDPPDAELATAAPGTDLATAASDAELAAYRPGRFAATDVRITGPATGR